MELKEIKDIRVGQIWQSQNNDFIFSVIIKKIKDTYFECDMFGNETWCREDSRLNKEKLIDFLECELTGFIGITHKIENNKLIEIERKEFEEGDIIKIKNDIIYVMTKTHNCGNGFNNNKTFYTLFNGVESWESFCLTDEYFRETSIKIGVYGVTHEFINKSLIKE